MENSNSFINRRPQRLCLMCGKCCRVVTTSTPYKELLKLKKNHDKGATEFLDIFKPYKSIEEAKLVDKDIVNNIIKMNTNKNIEFTFYRCKYLLDNNLCGKYETRQELCHHFPSSPWAVIPPGCGYKGWLFMEREKITQNVRILKEDLLELDLKIKHAKTDDEIAEIKNNIKKINDYIDLYAKYGSKDW